ncbi:CNBP [Mytilus edulis]|uniref:CNBP n=1 Tax=Mytilus edulis TaxID=6550 RepID=A0A8S3PQG4_MYTED|nr:CNBP [Mytilus edulis]
MSIININTCSFQELLQLPGIGIKTGEQIMDIREGKGFVTESDLATISHLRVTMALLSRLDFNQNGGGQNNGPPPEAQGRHNEMLSRVNTLIGGGHVASQGTPARVHAQSEFKQEAWHQGQSPGPWNGPSQMDSAFLECSPYSGDAGARPKTPGNWDGGYREQITKNEWSQPMMGDPNQSNPQHQGSSINAKQHWPGEASAWDKTVPTKRGAPSYPMGHTSNYAGQGSAPCTQPAHTGGGQYETPRSRYGKWQDNRGEDPRQGPAPTYEERPNNRGEDPRRTPARAYGDRQSQTQYNQGYTPVPPQGVTTGGSYEQHAYPMPHNEDRPRENIRGPDSRGGARATSGNSSLALRQEAPSPGGRPAGGGCFHCGERGHFKRDCPKFRGRSPSRSPSPYRGSGRESVCYNCYKPGHMRNECPDLQSKEKTVTFADQSRMAPSSLNSNGAAPQVRASPQK